MPSMSDFELGESAAPHNVSLHDGQNQQANG